MVKVSILKSAKLGYLMDLEVVLAELGYIYVHPQTKERIIDLQQEIMLTYINSIGIKNKNSEQIVGYLNFENSSLVKVDGGWRLSWVLKIKDPDFKLEANYIRSYLLEKPLKEKRGVIELGISLLETIT
ncbi:hypothetical protein C0584_00130 [Candidatus Parcubacteria bacterium]|nr:MAG: hypothetical protein C0584_00130 [Candidatus Parcubacteria bacterium]